MKNRALLLPWHVLGEDCGVELERLGEEGQPAEVGRENAACGGGPHDDTLLLQAPLFPARLKPLLLGCHGHGN